jgi:hypothetical protein
LFAGERDPARDKRFLATLALFAFAGTYFFNTIINEKFFWGINGWWDYVSVCSSGLAFGATFTALTKPTESLTPP